MRYNTNRNEEEEEETEESVLNGEKHSNMLLNRNVLKQNLLKEAGHRYNIHSRIRSDISKIFSFFRFFIVLFSFIMTRLLISFFIHLCRGLRKRRTLFGSTFPPFNASAYSLLFLLRLFIVNGKL